MKIRNAIPKMFYGLHFQDGVAHYKDLEDQPMVYVGSDTAKRMDRTFQGRPVFVLHEDDVDISNVQDADGVVVRSFYNKADGNHWAEFLVYTDDGLDKIKKGWKLSNAYEVTGKVGSGNWHGVDYDYEITDGDYEHLAIVPNPRYADSIILTPDEFKQYNLDKEAELQRLSNSKGENKMFKLFKKEKVKNSDELAQMSVILPKSKQEKTITQLVNEADESAMKKDDKVANEDSKIKVGDKELTVKELVNFYMENQESEKELENEEDELENEEDEMENESDEDELENECDEVENESDEDELENEEDEDEVEIEIKNKKKKNSLPSKKKVSKKKTVKKNSTLTLEEAERKAKIAVENYRKLKNAQENVETETVNVDLSQDKVARGNSRYGSK